MNTSELQFKFHEIANNHKFFKYIHEGEAGQFVNESLKKFSEMPEVEGVDKLKELTNHLNNSFSLKTPSNRRIRLRVVGSFDTYISIYPHWVTPNNKKSKSSSNEKAEA